jgi:hypothetical protein
VEWSSKRATLTNTYKTSPINGRCPKTHFYEIVQLNLQEYSILSEYAKVNETRETILLLDHRIMRADQQSIHLRRVVKQELSNERTAFGKKASGLLISEQTSTLLSYTYGRRNRIRFAMNGATYRLIEVSIGRRHRFSHGTTFRIDLNHDLLQRYKKLNSSKCSIVLFNIIYIY